MAEQQQSFDVTRLLRQQAALANFGSYAFREGLLLNILNEAARACAGGLGVPLCKICRYREVENDLLIEAGFGWHDGVVGQVVSQADATSPQGRAFSTGLPVIIQNLHEAKNFVPPPFYQEHGVVSIIDVIIKGLDGKPYGVLEIDNPTQHTYDQHDVTFLTCFANVLAEAVAVVDRNILLFEAIRKMEMLVLEKDKLLAERGVLAEELKHRVRNNLQLVQGMLATHEKNCPAMSEKASVNAITRRVMTLAEVYEQLLGTGMDRTIDLGTYLQSLCISLPGLQTRNHEQVQLTCVVQPILVDLDTVTAIGMVVAETVSNSYEHAFRNVTGCINVSLQRSEIGDQATLTVSDDGSGFVERPGSKRHGVGLVRRLVEQVHGTVELRSERGATWTFRFPVIPGETVPGLLESR